MSQNIVIVTEPTGKKFVLINDLRFKDKTKEEWNEIENFLMNLHMEKTKLY